MRKREIHALHQTVGEVGISLGEAPFAALQGSDGPAAARLRRAVAAGVGLFDLTFATNSPAWEGLLGGLLRETGPHPLVVLGQRSPGRGGSAPLNSLNGPAIGGGGEPDEGWEGRRRRLGVKTLDVVLAIDPSPSDYREPGLMSSLSRSVAEGSLRAWGVAWSRPHVAREEIPKAVEAGARVLGVPFNLLDPSALADHSEALARRGVSTIVLDPFAEGRLDGTFLREGPLTVRAGGGVADLATLHRRFDPITRLGFLTESRRRTLAQAALQVALATPSVAVVSVAFPPPEKLEEYVSLERLPPIDEGEWNRWYNGARDSASISNIGGTD